MAYIPMKFYIEDLKDKILVHFKKSLNIDDDNLTVHLGGYSTMYFLKVRKKSANIKIDPIREHVKIFLNKNKFDIIPMPKYRLQDPSEKFLNEIVEALKKYF